MRNLNKRSVKYPQKERACAFMGLDGVSFTRATVGITYPFSAYSIYRDRTTKTNLFELVLEGKGEVWIDGRWQTVKKGDVYILLQEQEHRYHSDPNCPMKKIWVNYVADYMPAFLAAYGIGSGVYGGERAARYFERAYGYTQGESDDGFVRFDIAACVHQIIQAVAIDRTRQVGGDAYRIYTALHAAVYEPMTLDELSTTLHISKSNIIRLFKRQYGVTPYEYLLGLKIDAAKILLRNTHMSVKEIAERVCIADQHYFSTLFLSRVGMRPRDYRLAGSK